MQAVPKPDQIEAVYILNRLGFNYRYADDAGLLFPKGS